MKKYEAKIKDVDYEMLEGLGFSQVDDDVYDIKVYTFHRNYRIGDNHSYQDLTECIDDNKKAYHIFNLYMYDHSGLAFSLTDFNDRWDSGLLGYICIRKNISRLEANKIAYDMVQEANDIEKGAYVELIISELEICECCNNIKNSEYIEDFMFNIYNKEDKTSVVKSVNYYIKDFDINDLDKLIESRD